MGKAFNGKAMFKEIPKWVLVIVKDMLLSWKHVKRNNKFFTLI